MLRISFLRYFIFIFTDKNTITYNKFYNHLVLQTAKKFVYNFITDPLRANDSTMSL